MGWKWEKNAGQKTEELSTITAFGNGPFHPALVNPSKESNGRKGRLYHNKGGGGVGRKAEEQFYYRIMGQTLIINQNLCCVTSMME